MKSLQLLIAAHQTEAWAEPSNKANNIAFFDQGDVRKYFVDDDEVRYPKVSIDLEYEKDIYLNQHGDPNIF